MFAENFSDFFGLTYSTMIRLTFPLAGFQLRRRGETYIRDV